KPGPITVETTIHFALQAQPDDQPDQPPPTDQKPTGPLVTLNGIAKERGTRHKIIGATIALVPLAAGVAAPEDVATGADAAFVAHAPPGAYKLVAIANGYDRFQTHIELHADEETSVTLYLRPTGESPYEIVVEAEREKTEVTRHPLSRHELTTVPGTFGDPV